MRESDSVLLFVVFEGTTKLFLVPVQNSGRILSILYFCKSHNIPLPPQKKKKIAEALFSISLDSSSSPKRNRIQLLCKAFFGLNTMYYGICESRELVLFYLW